MDHIPRKNSDQDATTFIIRDLNINSQGRQYAGWATNEKLWVLASPQTPPHSSGTVDDATLIAIRDYVPEGVSPWEAENEQDLEKAEYCPV